MPLSEAVLDAGEVRFRPMLLTAAAVVVGSSVMLFDPIFQGLAVSMMAGEVAATLLSRAAVPVLYYLLKRSEERKASAAGTAPRPSPKGVSHDTKTLNEWLRGIAGTFVLLSLALGWFVHPAFFLFTAFVGANLLQSAFTRTCPMMWILRRLGVGRTGPGPRPTRRPDADVSCRARSANTTA